MERTVGRREWLVTAAILVVLAAVAAPALRGQMYLYNDLGTFHMPLRVFYQTQIQRGESPAWHSGMFNGFDLQAEGQLGMSHPVHRLLYRVFPLATAFNAELILNAITAMAGMFLFLRRWVDRRDAAMAGAIAFALGGFCASHTHHLNIVAAGAHLPWLLWAIDGVVRAPDRRVRSRWGLALGLATASQWLHGHPQFLWYSAMAEAGYALFLSWRRPGLLAQLALWKGLGLVAAGIQILPTLAAIRGSSRGEVDPKFLALGSLPPSNLLQLVMPYVYLSRVFAPGTAAHGTPIVARDFSDWRTGEFGFSLGMVPVAMLIWLTARRSALEPRERRLLAWSAVVALLAFVLALGDHSPLFRWLIRVPTFGMFRVNARAVLLVDLALCIMTAVAASHLARASEASEEANDRLAWRVWLLPVLGALVIVLVPWLSSRFPEMIPNAGFASKRLQALGLFLAIAAAGLVFVAARGYPAALTVALLLMVAELGVGWWTFIRQVPPMGLEAYLDTVPGPPQPAPARLGSDDNRLILKGYTLAGGYVSLTPLDRPALQFEPARRAAGASWLEVKEPERPSTWAPVEAPMARARLVTQVKRASEPDPALGTIDVASAALVDVPLPALSGEPGSARVVDDRPGRIVVRTESDARQVLVLTEHFDRGWRVDVDGRHTALLRVNNGFLGCVVPPGSHRLRFRYAPASHAMGAWMSLVGLAAMFGYVLAAHSPRLNPPAWRIIPRPHVRLRRSEASASRWPGSR